MLVEQVTEADGIRPLSEHVMLHLRHGGDVDVRHVLARTGGELVGYAHLDVTDQVAGPSAELAVTPSARRRGRRSRARRRTCSPSPPTAGCGCGRTASRAARRRSPRRWGCGAPGRCGRCGARCTPRCPRRCGRPAYACARSCPGLDDDEFVALNARAFVALPDQGSWTVDDLHLRMAEPWFDPAGFLVAEEDAPDGSGPRMVGFHWTKVHGADSHHAGHTRDHAHTHEGEPPHEHSHGDSHHGHEPIGEVYVVGVDPAHHGRGLGRALTLAGLQHLRSRGLPDAMLYVDAVNTSAISLYESLGFTRWDVDVEFSV